MDGVDLMIKLFLSEVGSSIIELQKSQ